MLLKRFISEARTVSEQKSASATVSKWYETVQKF